MKPSDIEMPEDSACATRVAWAGERFADLASGELGIEQGWFIWGLIVGWTDTPYVKVDDERQYNALARQIETLLRSLEE